MKTFFAICLFITAAAALAHGSGKHVAPAPRTIEIAVTENGFEPTPIKVKKGEPLKLVVTRTTDQTCAKELVIDEAKLKVALPLGTPVEVPFTPIKAGQIKYGCGMGKMMSAILIVK